MSWTDSGWVGTKDFASSGHAGTAKDPYEITSAADLAKLAKDVNARKGYSGKYFKQTANIKLGGATWVPIGNDYGNFQGRYDGQGFLIEGLTINTTSNYQGLFGYVQGSEFVSVSAGGRAWVKNVVLQGGSISGGQYTGGIVGYASSYVDIQNCKSNVTVKGTSYVGGIAGYLGSNSTLNNCINKGSVTASSNNAGGICGCASSATFSGDVNSGVVSGSSNVGGICGYSGAMSDCINEGDVSGTTGVGGIAGQYGTASGCIVNCTISGRQYVGGVFGYFGSTVTNCMVFGHINYTGDWSSQIVGSSEQGGSVSPWIGFTTNTTNITGCSFYGTSNRPLKLHYNATGPKRNMTACWSWCNDLLQVSSDIISDAATWTQYWAVVQGMNYGLPIQKELYAVAEVASSTAAEIAAALPNAQVYA